ncbi:MAG: tRNA 2-selenouridine(34) synthase MnmH [Ferruginibacter sp.]|nr:tRNA 2-selenouridine(34) synthase MnmH [Ferruginibacter sp.]
MAVQKTTIEQFLELAKQFPVLDVRSPGEYGHAHIPGAYNLPLFTDEERKVVGTAYKQESREKAIKTGLDYFGVKMRKMVEDAESIMGNRQQALGNNEEEKITNETVRLPVGNCVLVHCWRGGMRSAGVAWLLDLYGCKVYTLTGGYKAYRKWARSQFEKQYRFLILGGYTGSGKTLVLHQLKRAGKNVIDLEGLANHKGSAFGAFGEKPQPSQEMFENLLAEELLKTSHTLLVSEQDAALLPGQAGVIYLEDESQRIGLLNIPTALWDTMRNSPVTFIDIPFEERLSYLTEEYGKFEKENLVNAIIRIQKRLGGLETKTAVSYLLENNYKECFRVLLKYYDKCYEKALLNRENLPAILNKIGCASVDVKTITNTLINETATA